MDANRVLRCVRDSVILLAILGASASLANTGAEQAADYYKVIVSGRLRGPEKTPFQLTLDCSARSTQYGKSGNRPAKYIGTSTTAPDCTVTVVQLILNKREVPIPRSSFEDLSNVAVPLGVYLTTRGRTVVLHLKGGDGEDSYEARLLFVDGHITGREIETMNDEGEPLIKTEHFNTE